MIKREAVEDEVLAEILYVGAPALAKAGTILAEEDFLQPDCAVLFGAAQALFAEHREIVPLEFQSFLQQHISEYSWRLMRTMSFKEEKEVLQYITLRLVDLTALYAKGGVRNSFSTNCAFVRDEARRAKLKSLLLRINHELSEGREVDEVLETATQSFISFAVHNQDLKGFNTLGEATLDAINETQEEIDGKVVRLPTGIAKLDEIIFGLERGSLYCIAAEAKVGKSFLANQIGYHCAQVGRAVGIISLEMRPRDIAKRYAGVHNRQAPKERMLKLLQFSEKSSALNLVLQEGSATPDKVFLTARKMWHEKKIELLIIDYLQLVEVSSKDRVNDINQFVTRLKGLANDLEIPVILITAVLTKQMGSRGSRKPTPADIRDTGRLYNDADCGILLWKPFEDDPAYIELFVAWSRNADLEHDKVGLLFDKDTLMLNETELREPPSSSWSPTNFLG